MADHTNTDGFEIILGSVVDAVYTKSKDPLYRHNRLVEALPPKLSHKLFKEETRWHPAIDKDIQKESKEYRGTAIERINAFIEPLPIYTRFYDLFYGQLVSGYFSRNLSSADVQKQLHSAFPTKKFTQSVYGSRMRHVPQASRGSCALGISGCGKSTMVSTILELFPQVIIHSPSEDLSIGPSKQVVWIKLGCPPKGSVKGLIYSFFMTVDMLLGTDYVNKYSSHQWNNEDKLIIQMAIVARKINLGILIIDEIQNLRVREESNPDSRQVRKKPSFPPTLLKVLVTFSNEMNIPILFVGTPDAEELLGKSMPLARRSSQAGKVTVARFKEDKKWKDYLTAMFKYNVLKSPISVEELSPYLYKASQGIVEFANSIYMFSQAEALLTADEKMSGKLIKDVTRKYLGPVLPWLDLIGKHKERELYFPEYTCLGFSWANFFQDSHDDTEGSCLDDESDGDYEDENDDKELTKEQDRDRKKKGHTDKNIKILVERGIIKKNGDIG